MNYGLKSVLQYCFTINSLLIPPFLSIVFFSLILSGCTTTGEGYMQQDELLAQINKNQAPIIVDVRSTYEYQSGHVPGAIHIPFWTAFTTDKLDGYDKNSVVVLYCAHGPRAGVVKLAS